MSHLVATSEPSLMNLVLAYSASHRANLLGHELPARRIELYLHNVPGDLRWAINDRSTSPATLTMLLMLTSMRLTCDLPANSDAFRELPWHFHLKAAKRLVYLRRSELRKNSDDGFQFLVRWFAQLESMKRPVDVEDENPLVLNMYGQGSCHPCSGISHPEEWDTHIDCLWGTSLRCLMRVTKTIQLIGRASSRTPFSIAISETSRQLEAMILEKELNVAIATPLTYTLRCQSSVNDSELPKLVAINQSFHLAALIHLHRGLLRKPSSHHEVQGPTKRILSILDKLGASNNVLLFPTMTAAFEAQSREDREIVIHQFELMESIGFSAVRAFSFELEKILITNFVG